MDEVYRSILSSKGQLVIPARLRRRHGLEEGTEVLLEETADGRIALSPLSYKTIYSLEGCLAEEKPAPSELLRRERRRERAREDRR